MALPDFSKLKFSNDQKLTIQVDRFNGGVNTLLSAPRLKPNESIEARNLMLVEDGLWTKRWGSNYYGGMLAGDKIDGFAEYRKTDGDRELIVFSGGLAQRKNGVLWTTIAGYTPTAGTPVYALQIENKLYACNGTDSLARYDGTSFSVYTALSVPTGLAGALTVLTAGNYHYYAQVTALNAIGETIASTEVSVAVNKPRDQWLATEFVTWTWNKVTDAVGYCLYLSGFAGDEGKLADIDQSDTPTFKDAGTLGINPYAVPSTTDSSGGPKFKYMTISNNRLWGCGDPDNPWRVYWTGKKPYVGSFNLIKGGGWVDLEEGGKAITKGIIDFQGKPAVFCPTPEGRGTIWQISLDIDPVFTQFNATVTKVTNQISSTAPRGILQAENDVFFPTKRGIFILGNEPGVMSSGLRTNELSAKIRDYMESMSDADLEAMCSYYRDGKVFFAIPNKIFYYDRERLCWVKDWTIGFSQMGDFTDENGVTHFLGAGSNTPYMYEVSVNYSGDCGVVFNTSYLSPHIPISQDWTKFAKITKAFINLGKTQGSVTLELMGVDKKGSFITLASRTITPGLSSAGMGWDLMGTVLMGDSAGFPTTFAQASTIRYMKVNKLLREVQFHVTTNTLSSQYTLLGLKAEGFPVQTSLPSSYKLV